VIPCFPPFDAFDKTKLSQLGFASGRGSDLSCPNPHIWNLHFYCKFEIDCAVPSNDLGYSSVWDESQTKSRALTAFYWPAATGEYICLDIYLVNFVISILGPAFHFRTGLVEHVRPIWRLISALRISEQSMMDSEYLLVSGIAFQSNISVLPSIIKKYNLMSESDFNQMHRLSQKLRVVAE